MNKESKQAGICLEFYWQRVSDKKFVKVFLHQTFTLYNISGIMIICSHQTEFIKTKQSTGVMTKCFCILKHCDTTLCNYNNVTVIMRCFSKDFTQFLCKSVFQFDHVLVTFHYRSQLLYSPCNVHYYSYTLCLIVKRRVFDFIVLWDLVILHHWSLNVFTMPCL